MVLWALDALLMGPGGPTRDHNGRYSWEQASPTAPDGARPADGGLPG